MIDQATLLAVHPPHTLDADGRCCGRKPIEYRRSPQLFCARCDRAYDPATKAQRPNFAWVAVEGGFALSQVSASAKVTDDTWRYQKDSGIPRDMFGDVVRDTVAEFGVKYREKFA